VDFLGKPFSVAQLGEVVTRLLGQGAPGKSGDSTAG
jgi:hypothetical protein